MENTETPKTNQEKLDQELSEISRLDKLVKGLDAKIERFSSSLEVAEAGSDAGKIARARKAIRRKIGDNGSLTEDRRELTDQMDIHRATAKALRVSVKAEQDEVEVEAHNRTMIRVLMLLDGYNTTIQKLNADIETVRELCRGSVPAGGLKRPIPSLTFLPKSPLESIKLLNDGPIRELMAEQV